MEKLSLKVWLGLGAATLVWSTVRAGKGQPVWPGILDASGAAPGALPGALETVGLWPLAVLHNLTAKPAVNTTATTTAARQLLMMPLHRIVRSGK